MSRLPKPIDTPIRALVAGIFILFAAAYLGFVIATDGLASAIVPALSFAVIGGSAVGYLASRR
jgi:hypothetical protein